jgi:hypothetical protein
MRAILIACGMLLFFLDGFSETLSYQTIKDNNESNIAFHDVVITDSCGNYAVTTYFPNESWEFILSPLLSTIEWKYSNPDMGVDVKAVKTSNFISIKGINKNEKYAKQVKLDSEPWLQQWDLGLKYFVVSTDKRIVFYSFNPMDVSIFGKFEANKLGLEKITVNGEVMEARHVRINLEGLFAAFWHGDYYFRPDDGRFILYLGKTGPADSMARVELISEKE